MSNTEDPDWDDPILELREQERPTSPDFHGRVRRSIHRRIGASQVAGFSWNLPKVVLVEMASLLGYLMTTVSGKKEGKQ